MAETFYITLLNIYDSMNVLANINLNTIFLMRKLCWFEWFWEWVKKNYNTFFSPFMHLSQHLSEF